MMATLKKPFDESSLYKLIHAIVYTDRKPLPIAYSRGFDHLIGQMLEKDPRLRPSASQLLEHLLLLKESSAIEQKPLDLLARHDLLRILKQPQKVKKLLSEEEQREFSTLTMNLSIIRNTPRDQTDRAHARVKTGKSRERGESGGGSTTRAKRTSEVGDDDEEITLRSFASWGETFVDRGETANSQKTITSSIASSTAHSMSCDESTFIDRGTMRPVSDTVTSLPLSLSMIHFEESLLDPETKPRQEKTLKSRENSSASLSFTEQDPARSAQHQKIKSSGKSPLTVSKSSEEALHHNRTKSARRQAKLPLKMTKSTVEESDNGATKSAYHQSMESPLALPNTVESSLYHYRENSAQHRTVTPSETSSKLLSSTSCRDTVDSGETKPSMTSSLPATLQKPSRLSILVSTIGAPSKTTGVSESDDHISNRVGSSLDVQMENLKKSLKRALSQSPSLDHDAIVDLLTASQNPYTALAQLMKLLDETEY
ncbi:serine/threonine-protein kinase fray2-like [Pomacea canaliculata]|uniref:serine/threonine-protein kinase fray2-like n=1 Tax=Pomacea canaliculata TaxID=400727 RepID=UPI000D733666|nr:serine/threonine-protein kinase fray2-like [Pomacea canaliculata]XP_025107793.1 serine/threonine-protein kinase fray2-like [Pomacea canaliculata]